MSREIFADTIGAIHVTGNLVRIDLMSFQPEDGQSPKQDPVKQMLTHRLIIPLEGFVGGFNLQEQVVRQLTKNGVLLDGRTLPASEENQRENLT